MKKKLLLIGLSLILTFSLAFAACNNGGKSSLSSYDAYGIGAVSGVKLLGSNVSSKAIKTLYAARSAAALQTEDNGATVSTLSNLSDTASPTAETDGSEQAVKDQAERFNEYFTALDSFLGEDVVSTKTEQNTDSAYPYEVKMTISGRDFDGEVVTYVMYYTETLQPENSFDFDDDDDDEMENQYRLVGVMVIDGINYHLEGERTEETEKDETETELKIRAYADVNDKSSYVQMVQEHSVESNEKEMEYVYSIYENGKLIEQTAVEFETERDGNKVETEYELEFRSGAYRGRYSVEREVKNNKTEITVRYNIDGKSGNFRINEIVDESGNKKYRYTYNDGDVKIF